MGLRNILCEGKRKALRNGEAEQGHDLHVVGLGEHVDQRKPLDGVTLLRERSDVPGQGGGVARDVDDSRGAKVGDVFHDGFPAGSRRIENDEVSPSVFPISPVSPVSPVS